MVVVVILWHMIHSFIDDDVLQIHSPVENATS